MIWLNRQYWKKPARFIAISLYGLCIHKIFWKQRFDKKWCGIAKPYSPGAYHTSRICFTEQNPNWIQRIIGGHTGRTLIAQPKDPVFRESILGRATLHTANLTSLQLPSLAISQSRCVLNVITPKFNGSKILNNCHEIKAHLHYICDGSIFRRWKQQHLPESMSSRPRL